jgi:hypothetical protein
MRKVPALNLLLLSLVHLSGHKKHFSRLKNQVRTFKDADNLSLNTPYWTLKKYFKFKHLFMCSVRRQQTSRPVSQSYKM